MAITSEKESSMLDQQVYRLKLGTHGINALLTTANTNKNLHFQNIFGILKIEIKIFALIRKF